MIRNNIKSVLKHEQIMFDIFINTTTHDHTYYEFVNNKTTLEPHKSLNNNICIKIAFHNAAAIQ